jgi:DNA invertase Pin-like site-specific DNA recombinase
MAKAYSYLRFSTPEQWKGDSYRRQVQMAEDYATEHGLELDSDLRFEDLGVSAFRGKNAQTGALGAFRRLVEDGEITDGSFLLVENLDRLSRQDPWAAFPAFQEIINNGITIVTLLDRKVWSRERLRDNPLQIIESILLMTRSHEESVTKSRRLRSSWANKRTNARLKPLTSRGPSWLRLEQGRWLLEAKRAETVRYICELYARGMGAHKIAEVLNHERVPTLGNAKFWRRSSVVKVLGSPALVGVLIPHTVEVVNGKRLRKPQTSIENYYPAVIEPDVWEAISSRLNREGSRGVHANTPSELAGLLRCAHCGAAVIRKGGGRRDVSRYLCSRGKAGAGCQRTSSRCDVLLEFLFSRLEDLLGAEGIPATDQTEDRMFNLSEEIDGLRAECRKIANEIARGDDSRTLRQALREREATLERLEMNLEEAIRQKQLQEPKGLRQRFVNAQKEIANPTSPAALNSALKAIVSEIVVDLDGGWIDVHWRHGPTSALGAYNSMFR